MKAPLLCSLVASSAVAALTFSPLPATRLPAPRSPAEIAPHQASSRDFQSGWEFAETQLLGDPRGYRERASREMQTYAQAWQELRERCDAPAFTSRNYLPTRVRALREHLDYARAELLKLPSSPGDPAFTSAHSHFYRTLRYLEAAFAQAENELNEGV